ncbi:MAG: hypothetical protein ACLTKI_02440 [Lachnospiraceae bacterium]
MKEEKEKKSFVERIAALIVDKRNGFSGFLGICIFCLFAWTG